MSIKSVTLNIVLDHVIEAATITELWLQDHIEDGEIVPTNYTIVRRDRSSSGIAVVIVLKKGLTITCIPHLPELETFWLKVTLYKSQCTLVVSVVY